MPSVFFLKYFWFPVQGDPEFLKIKPNGIFRTRYKIRYKAGLHLYPSGLSRHGKYRNLSIPGSVSNDHSQEHYLSSSPIVCLFLQ